MRYFLLVGFVVTFLLAHAQQPSPAAPTTQALVVKLPNKPRAAVPYHAGAPEQRAEKMSLQRPALDELLGLLCEGDTVLVARFFRLGRSRDHVIHLVNSFHQRGIHFKALDLGIDTSTCRFGSWPSPAAGVPKPVSSSARLVVAQLRTCSKSQSLSFCIGVRSLVGS